MEGRCLVRDRRRQTLKKFHLLYKSDDKNIVVGRLSGQADTNKPISRTGSGCSSQLSQSSRGGVVNCVSRGSLLRPLQEVSADCLKKTEDKCC
jgi:hypothetical protein